ncbi:MAG: type III-B CRISPR module RAMP protein Cmr1 [Halothiobacillus sp.]|jgi:CRISPR-associated protein Cmr1|nr:type III-B CRISPR module RAMP protein Cmr1 [Halothiobacillus sp.]
MPLKFKEPILIVATYRIVTPMFIGDANQKASGISPASVKGALRFWWRALNWSRIRAKEQSDTVALQHLHSEESELFGSSADKGVAARFTLRVNAEAINVNHGTDWPNGLNDPSGYLGLGLWESGSVAKGNLQPHREYIKEDQLFEVELLASAALNPAAIQQLRDALTAWGLFGGLGSRARRGFGSVAIESLNDEHFAFTSVGDYQAAVRHVLANYTINPVQQPPFTAFSQESQFSISGDLATSARLAHRSLGGVFKSYRGSKDSPVRGEKKRVFGIPFAGGATDLEKNKARRASPLLFHIHPIGPKFTGAVLFLPAEFHYHHSLNSVDYSLASNFLKQLPAAVFA